MIPRTPFRLLEPAPPDRADTVELLGRPWAITEHVTLPSAGGKPAYTCVSYAWGLGRIPHPFDRAARISDRTIHVLEAVLRARPSAALWIDTLCVPQREPERTVCLRNLGAIYAKAPVVVVLSGACATMLEHARRLGKVEEADLLAFETDPWVARSWTYQEVVNSGSFFLVAEGSDEPAVAAYDLFLCVDAALAEFKARYEYDLFDLRTRHPRLDALEDVLADYMATDYLERSAYRALADNARRVAEQDVDRYFALMGSFTSAVDPAGDNALLPPPEQFMRLCEARADLSFVYSTALRSDEPGRSWRPSAGARIHPIFPWHTSSDRQAGEVFPSYARLDGMARVESGPSDAAAREFVREWHDRGRPRSALGPLPEVVLECLRNGGFSGCGAVLEHRSGYFFPQWVPEDIEHVEVLVSTTLRFVQGAPGLMVRELSAGKYRCCGVGVFVGRVPKPTESVSIEIY